MMDQNERSAAIQIGGETYELLLTTEPPKRSPSDTAGWKTSAPS